METIVIVGVLVVGVLSFSKGIINAVKNFKEKYPAFSYSETEEESDIAEGFLGKMWVIGGGGGISWVESIILGSIFLGRYGNRSP